MCGSSVKDQHTLLLFGVDLLLASHGDRWELMGGGSWRRRGDIRGRAMLVLLGGQNNLRLHFDGLQVNYKGNLILITLYQSLNLIIFC